MTSGAPNCGDVNGRDPGWPKKVKTGCGNAKHAVQYIGEDGKARVVLLCPRCDPL